MDRLDQNRADLRAVDFPKLLPEHFQLRLRPGKRQPPRHLRELPFERLAEPADPLPEQRPIAEAVVAALKGKNPVAPRRQHRRFQRCLYRLEAGIPEQAFPLLSFPFFEGDLRKRLAKLHLHPRRMDIAHRVHQGNALFPQRLAGEPVADTRHPEAAGHVEETVAVCIPHVRALRPLPKNRPVIY